MTTTPTCFAAAPMPSLWYENEAGERYIPENNEHGYLADPPPGFCYMHARFPRQLTETVLRINADGTSRQIVRVEGSYPADLALALARPSLGERVRAILRHGSPGPRMAYEQAVLHAFVACERCTNALAHRVGLDWGYRRESHEWHRAGTTCELCVSDVDKAEVAKR